MRMKPTRARHTHGVKKVTCGSSTSSCRKVLMRLSSCKKKSRDLLERNKKGLDRSVSGSKKSA